MDDIDTHQRKTAKPASTSLSQRIAARVQQKPNASVAARNRSAFLALREEIQQAYCDGWSLLSIWKQLHEEQRIPFTYQAFRRYARQLIGISVTSNCPHQQNKKGPEFRTQPKAAADAFAFKTTPAKEPLQ